MAHSKQAASLQLVRVLCILAGMVFAAALAFAPLTGWAAPNGAPVSQAGAWQATLVITDAHAYSLSPWSPWSPDGSKLVAASDDNTVGVWDATTGAKLATLTGHTDHVRSPAWSPDGSKIASVSWDGTARVWDAATAASLATFTLQTNRVVDLAWSPDSSKLAAASGLADGIIMVLDPTTGAKLATLSGHTHYLKSLAWSPDGSKLASASSDQTVRVWDATTGASLVTITNNNSLGTNVAWSPDGSKLASGFGNDGDIGVWDATTGASLATLTGHTDHVGDVAWSACSAFGSVTCALASASDDGTVRVWSATTGASLATLTGHTSGVGKVAWSPDGSKLASASARSGGDQTVRIWDFATGASLAALTGHTGTVSNVAWSPDGSKLASEGDGTVRVWAEVTTATSTPEPAATPASTPTSTPEPTATPPSMPPGTPADTPAPTATPMSTPTGTPDPNAIAFEPPSLEFVWEKGSSRNPASQSVLARNVGGAGWSRDPWIDVPSKQHVSGGLQMNIAVRPASNWDVGVQEGQIILTSNGMTITLPVKVTVVSADGTLQVNRQRLNFGGFVGDPIANQVVGVTFTGLNSTNWTASGPSWLKLTPASGSVAATAPTSLTVGIDAAAISGAGQYTGTLTVRDGKTTHEIAIQLSQVAPGSPTIQMFGLEVTQGLQNLLNDIPFVAERPVFVRGHVRSLTGDPIEKVTAQLIGTRDGAPLGTLNPINPGGSINVVGDPKRDQLNESFLFELPPNWRTGTVTLRLAGQSQPIACVDPAEKSAANAVAEDCTVTLTYETIPVLPIKHFLYSEQGSITYSNGGRSSPMTFTANAEHAAATSKQLLAGLPIPGYDQQIHGTVLTFPGVRDAAAQSKMDGIMRAEHEKAGKPPVHFYGLFARYKPATDPAAQVPGGPGGAAVVPGFFGFGEYYTFQPMATLNMHEIGHNLGRAHVNCGKPASPDLKYPYPDQRISDELSGNAAYYGFNIVDRTIYPPTHKDYMSYCHPQWVSPYTYKAMMERLKIHYDPTAGTSGTGKVGASPGSPILLISGRITDTAAGSIDGVVDDNASAALPAPDASDYSVRLEDASGQTIATYPVTPQASEGQNADEFTSYTLAIPRPENLARVVLLYQDQELAERVASANAPVLTLTSPVGGESLDGQPLAITWDASDADGDALTFNVDYSTDDGATWQKLAWGWPETTFEVGSAQLPGSTQARLRVAANDGFLTTFAESETFVVADHPPVAIILTTDLNRYYVGGQTILLEGTGYDLEDGMVSDLTWYSDREGMLGTGSSLLLDADNLAEGTHLIRLEAKDSTGQSSFGDPTVGVASAEGFVAANDTVSFDILYDPLTLPAELAVAPDLGFFATSGSTELLTGTLTVSNLGDGDLGWTASSDSANVTLSSSSGDTPATVVVSVNPADLADGLHEGTLTFTPDDATLAPVTVDYSINVYPAFADATPRSATCDTTDVPAPTQADVMVRFVNDSGALAVLYWRDSANNLVEYTRLDPDGFVDQETFETHEWVVQDEAGNLLLDYAASAAETQCVVIEQPALSDAPATPESKAEETDAVPESTSAEESPAAEAAEELAVAPAQEADRFPLAAGRTIARAQKVPSESGNHYLIFQPDGNVVVYTADDQYVWGLQSITDKYAQAQSVQMQPDGNFVVRGANDEFIWSALSENPDPSAYLTLTAEGVLQLVSGATGATLWASNGVTSLP